MKSRAAYRYTNIFGSLPVRREESVLSLYIRLLCQYDWLAIPLSSASRNLINKTAEYHGVSEYKLHFPILFIKTSGKTYWFLKRFDFYSTRSETHIDFGGLFLTLEE